MLESVEDRRDQVMSQQGGLHSDSSSWQRPTSRPISKRDIEIWWPMHILIDSERPVYTRKVTKRSSQLRESAIAAKPRQVAAADVAQLGATAERHGDEQLIVE